MAQSVSFQHKNGAPEIVGIFNNSTSKVRILRLSTDNGKNCQYNERSNMYINWHFCSDNLQIILTVMHFLKVCKHEPAHKIWVLIAFSVDWLQSLKQFFINVCS